MGCFNKTSFLTGLPIEAGEKIAAFILPFDETSMVPNDQELPNFPIFGDYDDYGSICNIDQKCFGYRFIHELYPDWFDEETLEESEVNHEYIACCEKHLYDKYSILENKRSVLGKKPLGLDIFRLRLKTGNIHFNAEGWTDMIRTKEENKILDEIYGDKEWQKNFRLVSLVENYQVLQYFYFNEWSEEVFKLYNFWCFTHRVRRPIISDACGLQTLSYGEHLSILNDTVELCKKKLELQPEECWEW
jgi:hypothetical protein